MVQALQPFAKAPNPILPIDSSQMLVLRDFTENVKRMLELIKEIDVAVPSEFIQEVIPIKYALASEISSALNSLGSGGGGATVGGGSTTGGATSSRTSSYGRSNSNMGRSGMGMNQGGYGMNPMATTTGAAQPSTFGDRLQQIMRRASVTGDIQVIGSTKIIADERTNSLLIFASREDMKVIKDIISKLDVVLAQVLIEAVIIEVNLGDDRALGLNYLQKPQTAGNFTGVGAINNKAFLKPSDYILGTSTGTNGSSGGLPSGLSYLGSFGQDLDVSLVAIASDNRAKILQRPYIQTSHAVPATLFVGESRPYPMGSYYGGGSYGSYSSIQQIQIGVTLEVTPLINPDGLVVMDIHQKIESANGSVNIANVGDVPVTSQKDAVAKVAVRDRDTIMLGGLIETSKSKTASGVPYLKDIPVLGYLFRSSSSKEIRNEMIVLIRPTVLPTPEIAALTARSEKAKMPGIRRAEAELEKDQADRIRALEREEKAARPTDGANDPRFAPVEGL
jgi:general secretion pathway protein D